MMDITIIKENGAYRNDCEEVLLNSELGIRYFPQKERIRKLLDEGFHKEEIYIAIDKNDNFKGFIWINMNGMFHSFPYIYFIIVKEENRNQGVGKKLLTFAEHFLFEKYTKLFLVVGDFNPDAKRLYENLGYSEIAYIPNLYTEGITECVMMKSKEV